MKINKSTYVGYELLIAALAMKPSPDQCWKQALLPSGDWMLLH